MKLERIGISDAFVTAYRGGGNRVTVDARSTRSWLAMVVGTSAAVKNTRKVFLGTLFW